MSTDDMFKPENPLNLNDNLFSRLTDNVHDCEYFDFSKLPSKFYSANGLLVLHTFVPLLINRVIPGYSFSYVTIIINNKTNL